MPNLVQLAVRGPSGRVVANAVETADQGDTLYLCGRERCPHWGGQAGLFGGNSFGCLLTGADPVTLCQPFYTEAAEDLDQARRSVLPRLESDPEELRLDLLRDLDDAVYLERKLAAIFEALNSAQIGLRTAS